MRDILRILTCFVLGHRRVPVGAWKGSVVYKCTRCRCYVPGRRP